MLTHVKAGTSASVDIIYLVVLMLCSVFTLHNVKANTSASIRKGIFFVLALVFLLASRLFSRRNKNSDAYACIASENQALRRKSPDNTVENVIFQQKEWIYTAVVNMLPRALYDVIPGQDSQTVVNIRLLLRHHGPVKPAK